MIYPGAGSGVGGFYDDFGMSMAAVQHHPTLFALVAAGGVAALAVGAHRRYRERADPTPSTARQADDATLGGDADPTP